MGKIYIYDNNIGIDLPNKIDEYQIELLFGTNISDIHNQIQNDAILFCVFTALPEHDFIVQSVDECNNLQKILSFGKLSYNISIKDSSIWYPSNNIKTIIISNNVKISSNDICEIIKRYIQDSVDKKTKISNQSPKVIYTVVNRRNSKILLKTPDKNEAIRVCNKNTCCIVIDDHSYIIHRSNGSKAIIPKKSNHLELYKSSRMNNNRFKISIK